MIAVNEPLLDGNEKKYLAECIDSGWISAEGPFVKRFEEEFSKRMGRKFGIAVSNGTAALDVAIEALGLKDGDEVIMPTFTIISCIGQIIRAGAVPVLVDSESSSWNMDPELVESKITSRTKAIMIVHIYGMPVNMAPILKLVDKYQLKLIEDAAEAIGQNYFGRPCGSFGDISTFSFYSNKHITTGEGGMLLTDDPEVAEECRSLRNLCFIPGQRFVHERLGWNYRMTNIQAALGLAQLERLDEFIEKKILMGSLYSELLSDIRNIQLPVDGADYAKNIYWVYGIVLGDDLNVDARKIMARLEELGVGTRPFFYPMHQQPVLQQLGFFRGESYPVAERLYRQGFYIPSGLALTEGDIAIVSEKIKSVLG